MTTASVLRCAPERYHDEMDEVQSTWECRVGLVDVLGHASCVYNIYGCWGGWAPGDYTRERYIGMLCASFHTVYAPRGVSSRRETSC